MDLHLNLIQLRISPVSHHHQGQALHLRGEKESRTNATKYRVHRPEGLGQGFSFYVHTVRMRVTALSPLQPQFPAVGHLFNMGAVPFSIADQFVRAVEMKITTELPIYNPEFGQYVGGRATERTYAEGMGQ